MLYAQSACEVMELLEYWAEEPPAHVTLALRYLGQSRGGRAPLSEEQAQQEMASIGAIVGGATVSLPNHVKELIRQAELMKQGRKGLVN